MRMIYLDELVGIKLESDPTLEDLIDRVCKERLYTNHALRMYITADTISMPGNQLRRKINKDLGYRNFNQFVNRYRTQELGQRIIEI